MNYTLRILAGLFISIRVLYAQSAGWSVQSSHTTENLRGIAGSDFNTWIAVGDAGTILRSSDGGIHWAVIASPVGDALRGVSLRGRIGLAVGIAGRVLRTTDSGLNWIEETRPTSKNLYSVSLGDQMAVIGGEEGTILVSLDDGLNWTPHTAGTASVIFGIAVNGTTAVGVGGAGAVVMTTDHGKGWGLTVLGNQLTFFYSTSFINGPTGWAVGSSASTGNVIIHSTDYGFVWTGQAAPTSEQLFGVSFPTIDSGCAVGSNGTIIRTSDGGANWLRDSSGLSQIFNAVSFANSRIGIIVGDGGTILRTTPGGTVSAGRNVQASIPKYFTLGQNYPNPFNPSTTISFSVGTYSHASLRVFNVLGQEVATVFSGTLSAGSYTKQWNAEKFPSGVYFYQLQDGSLSETRKLLLIK
jgi:photosystem II stability/assembly factor-like uncharacterized protein